MEFQDEGHINLDEDLNTKESNEDSPQPEELDVCRVDGGNKTVIADNQQRETGTPRQETHKPCLTPPEDTRKIKPLPNLDRGDYNNFLKKGQIKEEEPKKFSFWKIFAVGSVFLFILVLFFILYFPPFDISPIFNSTNNIDNQYEMNPNVNIPTTNNNTFENNFEFTFELNDEFIESLCNISG